MEKTRRNYPDIAPAGPTYNRAIRSGNWLFISGCTARGTPSQGKSLMEQLRVTLDRIGRIVAAEGGKPGDIVKITTYVTSIADWRAHVSEQQDLFTEYFRGEFPRTRWSRSAPWQNQAWMWRLRRRRCWIDADAAVTLHTSLLETLP